MKKIFKTLVVGFVALLFACGTLLPLQVENYRGDATPIVDSLCQVYEIPNVPVKEWAYGFQADDEDRTLYQTWTYVTTKRGYRNNFVFVYELPDSTLQFRIE